MITLHNVSFGYKKGETVIKNINLNIQGGICTAIIGPNGSGKTTLGKLMAGILKPNEGKVLVGGLDTREVDLCIIGEKIGYLFQEPERQIFAPSVREELAFVMELKGLDKGLIESKVDDTLEQFQIKELEKAFPFQLSRGEKQRLAIASIMINNPPFFILDEPTTGLDIERKGILSTLIGNLLKNGIGMVIISHDRAFVKKHGQRVISMLEGEIGYDETSIY